MPEVREIIERFRGDRGIDELIALLPLLQGQLDPYSFMAGMLFGKSTGRGLDHTIALFLAMGNTTANAGAQQPGAPIATNPMQQMLPLLLLLGRHDEPTEKIEIIEKQKARA